VVVLGLLAFNGAPPDDSILSLGGFLILYIKGVKGEESSGQDNFPNQPG
jgi:hypothetical protein